MSARLGDDVDDYCIKCKRLTNHVVVSLLGDEPAKVRCRTCHSDHDYRHEQLPPPKIDARKTAAKAAADNGAVPAQSPVHTERTVAESEAVAKSQAVAESEAISGELAHPALAVGEDSGADSRPKKARKAQAQ